MKAPIVKAAIEELGYKVSEHKDKDGNPHLVIEDAPDFTKGVAVFMADCGKAGCEDLVFYADFGPSKTATMEFLNEWNHPASNLRSTAFKSGTVSGDGTIGISMPASFFDDSEQAKVSWLAGLFMVEVSMFGASLGNR
ncbi:YbjN domain-containing protein [Nisaea acidiphila]|uniref:YbjN domain-containing protein n=1 Tax=Nisaea acidiphila TaxID=1862145 RepID=A0A9J7AYF7_9PROT|nr:YbjN domain-containing protein [Nisaea acidiphila]UUX51465.1 YbjN domain-containing protein [Nisaea acidiphila]